MLVHYGYTIYIHPQHGSNDVVVVVAVFEGHGSVTVTVIGKLINILNNPKLIRLKLQPKTICFKNN